LSTVILEHTLRIGSLRANISETQTHSRQASHDKTTLPAEHWLACV